MKILLFAGIAEALDRQELMLPQQSMTVAELKAYLAQVYPQIKDAVERAMIAVNQEFAEDQTIITENDEVAIIPPVSGG